MLTGSTDRIRKKNENQTTVTDNTFHTISQRFITLAEDELGFVFIFVFQVVYLLVSVTDHERRLRNLKRVQEFLEQERQIKISMEEGRGHRHVILANFFPLDNVDKILIS